MSLGVFYPGQPYPAQAISGLVVLTLYPTIVDVEHEASQSAGPRAEASRMAACAHTPVFAMAGPTNERSCPL